MMGEEKRESGERWTHDLTCDVFIHYIIFQKIPNKHFSKSVHNIGGLETFPCDICDKEFYQRNKLNEHKRVHDGDTTCDLCNKVFYNVSTMRKHKERGSCFKRSGQQLNKLVKLNNVEEDVSIFLVLHLSYNTCLHV